MFCNAYVIVVQHCETFQCIASDFGIVNYAYSAVLHHQEIANHRL